MEVTLFRPKTGGNAIRDPRDRKQWKGDIKNPVRDFQMAGADAAARESEIKTMAESVVKPMPGKRP